MVKITHQFNNKGKISKQVDTCGGFLLTNNLGGYLWLGQKPESRYQGWFFTPAQLSGKKNIRIIESLAIEKAGEIEEIKNDFWRVARKRGDKEERFFLPRFYNSLVYEISEPSNIDIFLDVKEAYDNFSQGGIYQTLPSKERLIIKYSQPGFEAGEIFLAIRSDCSSYEKKEQWAQRNYDFDKKRNSPPFERSVFLAGQMKNSQKIIFSVNTNKEKAIKEADYIYDNLDGLKKKEEKEIKKLWVFLQEPAVRDAQTKMAFLAAKNSLKRLLVFDENKNIKGMFAGLPWFFQFWQRDTALSLKALSLIDRSLSQKLFKDLLEGIIKGERDPSGADSWGWIIKQSEYLKIKKKHLLAAIELYIKSGQRETKAPANPFFYHHPKSTWMDTLFRTSRCVEIQALFANACRIASRKSEFWRKKFFYWDEEDEIRRYIKYYFWNKRYLADGLTEDNNPDFTLRPNMLLAMRACPKILNKKQTKICLNNLLQGLWLDWGGIATLDKNNPNFHSRHTGEIPSSYHQGDSWFYLNNLLAIILLGASRRKYKKYIASIVKASSDDILWKGIVGHHSELSSAGEQAAEGCLCQAWSSAFFLELIRELF